MLFEGLTPRPSPFSGLLSYPLSDLCLDRPKFRENKKTKCCDENEQISAIVLEYRYQKQQEESTR
jgi:hypothetical protein